MRASDGEVGGVAARTLSVAGTLFVMTAAFILTKTGRDALYFQGGGVYDLPKAYMAIAVFSVPTALLTLRFMRKVGPRRARLVAPLGMSVILAVFHRLARPGGGALMTVFFVLVPLVFGVLFSLSWLLAADLLDGAPRSRLARAYSLIGAAAILGGMAGGLLARGLAPRVEPQALIGLGALGLAASAAVMAWAQHRFPSHLEAGPTAAGEGEPIGWREILAERYPVLLLLVAMSAALVGVLVEFQLYLAAAASGSGSRESARFFASVYLVLNGAALVVQLLVLPLLQRRIGVQGSLLILPGALLGGALTLLASASLLTRSLLRVAEGGLRASIHRVSWEQAYLPLARARRVVAKVLVDGAAARVAEGLAAVVLYAWLHLVVGGRPLAGRSTIWITYLLLAACLAWFALTRRLAHGMSAVTRAADLEEQLRIDIPLPDT